MNDTVNNQDPSAASHTDYPHFLEPDFETLYQYYVRNVTHRREKAIKICARSPEMAEKVAIVSRTRTREEFQNDLAAIANPVVRQWYIDVLCLGPEYCEANPQDPRVVMPHAERERKRKIYETGFVEALTNLRPPTTYTGME